MISARLCVLLLWASSLSACARPGDTASVQSQRDLLDLDGYSVEFRADLPSHRTLLAAPLDQVEAWVPGVYELLGLPVAPATNTRERVFITPNMRIRGQLYEGERNSDYIDCGSSGPGGDRANLYEVQFAVFTRLGDGGEGRTVVETMLNGRAYRHGTGSNYVRCTGTGKLERMIASELRRRAAARGLRREGGRPGRN